MEVFISLRDSRAALMLKRAAPWAEPFAAAEVIMADAEFWPMR
jgi:hypothetical protein